MFDFAPPPPARIIPLQQSAPFNLALARLGVDICHHAMPGGSATLLLRRVRGLGAVGLVSRGPVWSDGPEKRRVAGLAQMRRALGLSHLILNPEHEDDGAVLGRAGFFRIGRAGRVAMLSLDGGPEAWLARMDGKWRNRLRHARRQGLVTERHDFLPDKGHWLFEKDKAQQRTRRYRTLPHEILTELSRSQPGVGQLFLARRDRVVEAAMLFLCHGAMATYQIGWTSPGGRSASAHNLLMWEAMQALALRGHRMLDLGVIDPGRTPGIDRFKTGAGAAVQTLGGTWIDSGLSAPIHALRRRAAKS
ncbi:GNAT family N-acetyltransferase [Rhodobacterales bacterium HKCCE3408]|nr:GNAT family N-acetyltransferase [Rhodobacterales bacterium HKCCE3408]